MGNRDIRRSEEGRGMGRGTRGIQDGHYRDFLEGKQDFSVFAAFLVVLLLLPVHNSE